MDYESSHWPAGGTSSSLADKAVLSNDGGYASDAALKADDQNGDGDSVWNWGSGDEETRRPKKRLYRCCCCVCRCCYWTC